MTNSKSGVQLPLPRFVILNPCNLQPEPVVPAVAKGGDAYETKDAQERLRKKT